MERLDENLLRANSTEKTRMQQVVSKDGTSIAYEKSGQGPAILIVGGSLADHHFYIPLAWQLTQQFTVYNIDRRGRGQSGEGKPYAVEREIEDIATLIDQVGGPVCVYGHSAGSALALQAASAGLNIAKMVLADPPFTPHSEKDQIAKAQFVSEKAKIQALVDKGDHKGVATFFLSGFGLSPAEVAGILTQAMIECARALPYDYAVLGDGLVPTALAAKADVPTLILAARTMPETAKQLVTAMPQAMFQAMEASTHELSPEEIGKVIMPFFS